MTNLEAEYQLRKMLRRDGRQVIEGNSPAVRPERKYVTTLLIHDQTEGYPIMLPDGNTDTPKMAVFSVNWYREPAQEDAIRFATYAFSPAGLEQQVSLNIRLEYGFLIQRLDELTGHKLEERSQADVVLYYRSRTDDYGVPTEDILEQITSDGIIMEN